MTYERKECRHCHQVLSVHALDRHEKVCAKSTPEERAARSQARMWAAQRADRVHPQARKPSNALVVQSRKVGRPRGSGTKRHHRLFTNGKGRRLYATISVDLSTALALIREAFPHIQIDRVGVN